MLEKKIKILKAYRMVRTVCVIQFVLVAIVTIFLSDIDKKAWLGLSAALGLIISGIARCGWHEYLNTGSDSSSNENKSE